MLLFLYYINIHEMQILVFLIHLGSLGSTLGLTLVTLNPELPTRPSGTVGGISVYSGTLPTLASASSHRGFLIGWAISFQSGTLPTLPSASSHRGFLIGWGISVYSGTLPTLASARSHRGLVIDVGQASTLGPSQPCRLLVATAVF